MAGGSPRRSPAPQRLPALALVAAALSTSLAPATAAAATAAAPAPAPGARDAGRPSLGADLGAYLAGADMLWSWNASAFDALAPARWSQGGYIGNGLLGAIVTAVVDASTNATTALRVDVSRTDVWECVQREPTGFLTIAPAPAPGVALARVDMRLELLTARLFVNFTLADGGAVRFRLLVGAADPLTPRGAGGVLALVVDAPAGRPLGVLFSPDSSGPCSDKHPAQGQVASAWGSPTLFATQSFSTGTVTAAWTDFGGDGGGGQAVILAVANSQRAAGNRSASQDDAVASVAAGVATTIASVEAAHVAWWRSFWSDTSFFSFDSAGGRAGVTRLEQFAHIAGYRYASASRFSMHDLMGPWGPSHATTCIGPWCQYVWDMNAQVMMYLPTPSNRGALLARPAFDMLPRALDGSWTAVYGSNSPGSADSIIWFTAQAWRYCAFHGDDARLLGSVLPVLRTYLARAGLVNGTDGRLHVKSCTSPEYPMSPAEDCNYQLSIFSWAAQTGLAIALALAPDDPGLPLFRDVAARLAPFPVDPATGSYAIAAGVPFAVPHRHYSHLLMMYDLGLVGGAGDVATMAASLDTWWSITCAGPQAHGPDYRGDDECRGFTQAAMAAMSAILNRTDAALGNLTSYLTLVGLPNAMYGEEVYAGQPNEFSPVSESAYSAAASVYGLLLQSAPWPPAPRSGAPAAARPYLRLWPAAPFANATFFRLRAEGALLVSAVREGGATVVVAVEADALADGSGAGAETAFNLYVPDWATAGVAGLDVLGAPGVVAVAAPQPGAWAVSGLVRGAAAAFYPAGRPLPSLVVYAAEGRNASEANAWGSRFVYVGELP